MLLDGLRHSESKPDGRNNSTSCLAVTSFVPVCRGLPETRRDVKASCNNKRADAPRVTQQIGQTPYNKSVIDGDQPDNEVASEAQTTKSRMSMADGSTRKNNGFVNV